MTVSEENLNYLSYCLRNPAVWPSFLSGLVQAGGARASTFLGLKAPGESYPDPRGQRDALDAATFLRCLPHIPFEPGTVSLLGTPLARLGMECSITSPDLFLEPPGHDLERYFFLHRHHWLLLFLAQRCSREDLQALARLIIRWTSTVLPSTAPHAWEPYSVSERIVHWLIFLGVAAQPLSLPPDEVRLLVEALETHLEWVLARLEIHGHGRTNNHVLNNARALLWGGVLLFPDATNPYYSRGISLWKEYAPRFIGPDGWLNEGSTHYQLLLHRTVAELAWLTEDGRATTEDREWFSQLRTRMERASRVCTDGVRGRYPLIGDISPDVPWNWFLPHDAAADGEHRVFGGGLITSDAASHRDSVERTSEIIRFNFGDWTLWVPFHEQGSPPSSSHGHQDLGSPVLFWQGHEVLIDVGRESYATALDRGAERHNTIMVGGFSPYPDHHPYRTPEYLQLGPQLDLAETADSLTVVLTAHGFRRLQPDLIWKRTLRLTATGLAIQDQLSGAGTVSLDTHFFLPALTAHELLVDRLELNTGSLRATITFTAGRNGTQHVRCDATHRTLDYGETAAAHRLHLRQAEARLPVVNEFRLEVVPV